MPGNAPGPLPAFASQFDARTWDNTLVMTIDGNPVTLPNYGDGEGVFDDALDFLNGRGSRDDDVAAPPGGISGNTLYYLLLNNWTGVVPALTVGIDANDRVFIESDAVDFEIVAGTSNSDLGFANTGHALVGGGGPFRQTATSEWVRGNITGTTLTIDPAGIGAQFSVSVTRAQSVVTWIRNQNEGDADEANATGNLEYLIQDALTLYNVRVGITDGGHVYFAWSTGAVAAVTWNSPTFRNRLGFSGSESLSTVGSVDLLIADYPLPGFWVPTRTLLRLESWHDEETSAVGLTDGDIATNHVARWTGWRVEQYAGGQIASQDDEWHIRDLFWRYAPVGYPLTVYPHWGEQRRQLYPYEVRGSQVAYDSLYTSEKRRGRLRGKRDIDDLTRRPYAYEGDKLQRSLLEVRLRDRAS